MSCQFATPQAHMIACSLYRRLAPPSVCAGCLSRGMNTEAAASAWRERAASLLPTLPQMARSLAAPQRGVGTELKKLLKRIGITSSPTCSCNRRAAEMDARGIQWCEQNIETIVGWLREEAGKRGLPFVDMAGTAIVKLAIRKAKRIG